MTSLGIDPAEVLAVSAKTGQGVPDVFRAIIERVPPPAGRSQGPAPRLDLRLQVRRLPGRHHLRPRRRRRAEASARRSG